MKPPTSRPVRSAPIAAALLLLAAALTPLSALMIACSMPCCEGQPLPFVQSPVAGACAERCAISSNTTSRELPAALAPSIETAKITIASLSVAEASETVVPLAPPRLPAFPVQSHHAVPGDAPVYLYNSVFLI